MAKIALFRYYADANSENYPLNLKNTDLANANFFQDYYPIIQLGIQALPGTKVHINDTLGHVVIIGSTGIYDLDLPSSVKITNFAFDLESVNRIQNTPGAYMLIDIVYEGGAE